MQTDTYKHLRHKPGSNYKQLFCGRIRAEVLYRETVGANPLTPEAVRRFLECHRAELMERFVREDVEWGCVAELDAAIVAICDATSFCQMAVRRSASPLA
jgi:hypothetical protein